jgi:hypothetical protein
VCHDQVYLFPHFGSRLDAATLNGLMDKHFLRGFRTQEESSLAILDGIRHCTKLLYGILQPSLFAN